MNRQWTIKTTVLSLLCSAFLLLAAIPAHAVTLNVNYTYDSIGRLTLTSYTNAPNPGSISYNYDPAGNLLTSTSAFLAGSVVSGVRDMDGDGVPDNLDAFPFDPAASIDTDGDGYPDSWNVNATAAQIANSPLSLDLFRTDPTRRIIELFPVGGILAVGWIQAVGSIKPWLIDLNKASEGVVSIKSGAIIDNQNSIIEHTVTTGVGNLSFDYMVSSEAGFDELIFYIDGVEQQRWSGLGAVWLPVTFPVVAGNHTFKWVYSKDGSVSDGLDTVWIDNVAWPASAGDTTPPVITLTGGNVSITQGSIYVDAGASAVDNVDGNIDNKIIVNSTVNTSVPGNYTVAYSVSDAAGNQAMPVTRSVTVLSVSVSATYNLTAGWNLVSFPLDLGATGLNDFIAQSPTVSEVWSYNTVNGNGQWSSYIVGLPPFLNALKSVQPGVGYWVKSNAAAAVTLIGSTPLPLVVPAYQAGWSLLGVLGPVADVGAYMTTEKASEVWGYTNGSWCSNISGLPVFLNCLKTLKPEAGYFIKRP